MTITQLLLQVGDLVPFVDEDYNHMPNGVKAIVVDSRVPSGYMIMLKDRRITAIWNKNGAKKIHAEDLMNAMRWSDGFMVNPTDSPESIMGQEWTDRAVDSAKKHYS